MSSMESSNLVVHDRLQQLAHPQAHAPVLRMRQRHQVPQDILRAAVRSGVTMGMWLRATDPPASDLPSLCQAKGVALAQTEIARTRPGLTSTNASLASSRPLGCSAAKVTTKRSARSTCTPPCGSVTSW